MLLNRTLGMMIVVYADLLHRNWWLITRRWNSCSGVFWSVDWFNMPEVVNQKMRRKGGLSNLWIKQVQVWPLRAKPKVLYVQFFLPLLMPLFPRIIFLSLITCLSGCSYFFLIAVIFVLRRDAAKPEAPPAAKEIELQSPSHPPKDPLNAATEREEGKREEGPRPQGQPETATLAAEPEDKVAWGRDKGRTGQMRLAGRIMKQQTRRWSICSLPLFKWTYFSILLYPLE